MNVVSRFGSFGKEVSLRGDHANGWIDDFASTEPEGDFDHSTLASEGSLGIPKVILLFQIPALVELVFDWDFDWKDVRPLPHVPKKLEAISIEANSSFSYSIFIIEIALDQRGAVVETSVIDRW